MALNRNSRVPPLYDLCHYIGQLDCITQVYRFMKLLSFGQCNCPLPEAVLASAHIHLYVASIYCSYWGAGAIIYVTCRASITLHIHACKFGRYNTCITMPRYTVRYDRGFMFLTTRKIYTSTMHDISINVYIYNICNISTRKIGSKGDGFMAVWDE